MQDNKLYRPPQGSLLGPTEKKASKPVSFLHRFRNTLLCAFPIFTALALYKASVNEWLELVAGAFLISLVCASVAVFIPTRLKSIYIPLGLAAGLGITLYTASH